MSKPRRRNKPERPFRMTREQVERLRSQVESAAQKGYTCVKVYPCGDKVKTVPVNHGKPERF